MAAGRNAQALPTSNPCSTRRRRRPPRTSLALVLDELDNLPVVDDRYRLWPWSLRALARRRGISPGTVHKHVQALRDTADLVDDECPPGRLLVDTAVLEERGRPTLGFPVASPLQDPDCPVAGDATEALLGAIDALTSAVEARPGLAEDLADPTAGSPPGTRRSPAPEDLARRAARLSGVPVVVTAMTLLLTGCGGNDSGKDDTIEPAATTSKRRRVPGSHPTGTPAASDNPLPTASRKPSLDVMSGDRFGDWVVAEVGRQASQNARCHRSPEAPSNAGRAAPWWPMLQAAACR